VWTGEEAGALRRALRLSVRAYAEHLGVAVRTVSKWEQLGAGVQPRPDTQAILDTALDRASPAERLRFQGLLAEASPRNGALAGPAETDSWDQETWADDLDRAVVLLSRQNFPAADAGVACGSLRCHADSRVRREVAPGPPAAASTHAWPRRQHPDRATPA